MVTSPNLGTGFVGDKESGMKGEDLKDQRLLPHTNGFQTNWSGGHDMPE